MKVVIDIPEIPTNDKQRWALAHGTPYEERPHGEWVKDFNMNKAIVCSECGEEAWYKEYRGWVTKSNFCPNCGADMRKRGDENERM